jgi:hypothetical protein
MMNVFLPTDRFVGRLIPSVVSGARCTQLLRDLDARGFARTGDLYPDDYRNNDRLVGVSRNVSAGFVEKACMASLVASHAGEAARAVKPRAYRSV